MSKVLVRYFEEFDSVGDLDGIFICQKGELEKIKGKEVYFGEVLGEHSYIISDEVYDKCSILSEDLEFINKLESVIGGKSISGYNPLDFIYDDE